MKASLFRSQRAQSQGVPPGQHVNVVLFDWPEVFLSNLKQTVPEFFQDMLNKFREGICLTTDYSGVGTPEACLQFLYQALQKQCADSESFQVCCLCVCDADAECRRVLLRHVGPAAPNCVLGDILDRCPRHLLMHCQAKLEAYRRRAEEAFSLGAPKKDVIQTLGREFILETSEEIFRESVAQNAWCYKHFSSQCEGLRAGPEGAGAWR